MKCPKCGEDKNRVVKTHSQKNFMMKSNIRTRQCDLCHWLWDTKEVIDGEPYQMKDFGKVYENQYDIFNPEEDEAKD